MKTRTYLAPFTLLNPPQIGVCSGCLRRKVLTIETLSPPGYRYCPPCEAKRPAITKIATQ